MSYKMQKFDFICDTVDNGIILLDINLDVHFWNSWLETRTNINSEQIIGKNLLDFYTQLNTKTLKRKINAALTLNSSTFYNTKINQFLIDITLGKVTDKVFNNMQQSVTITPFDLDKGLVILYIYDNTQLCEANYKLNVANEKLEDNYAELELLLNTTMEAIFLFEDDKCVNCNEVALELFKYQNKSNVLHKEIFDLVDNSSQFLISLGSDKPFEVMMIRHNSETFSALIRIKDTKLNNKNLKVLTVLDITELKAKDKLLAEQSKMAAMGEMIGNIAHQWRQPLSTISTAASGIKLQKDFDILSDEMFDEAVESIVRNAKHLSQTIDDFKNFLKGDKERSLFNLKNNIQTNLTIVEGMLKNEDIKVIVECEDNIDILNYPNELTQAFLNLFNNAKDAFGEHIPKAEPRYIFINAYLEDTKIYIEVTDNALGIDNEILHKIFEPYFTTKHKNQGTGLGLYMTHQLISISMGGSISVSNKTYRHNNHTYTGASFLITLPL